MNVLFSFGSQFTADALADKFPLDRKLQCLAITSWAEQQKKSLSNHVANPQSAKALKQLRVASQQLHRAFLRYSRFHFLDSGEWELWASLVKDDVTLEAQLHVQTAGLRASASGGDGSESLNNARTRRNEMRLAFLQDNVGHSRALDIWEEAIDAMLDEYAALSATVEDASQPSDGDTSTNLGASSRHGVQPTAEAMSAAARSRNEVLDTLSLALACEGADAAHGFQLWALQRKSLDMLYRGVNAHERAERESFQEQLLTSSAPELAEVYAHYVDQWELKENVKARFVKEHPLSDLMEVSTKVAKVLSDIANAAQEPSVFSALKKLGSSHAAAAPRAIIHHVLKLMCGGDETRSLMSVRVVDLLVAIVADMCHDKNAPDAFLEVVLRLGSKTLLACGYPVAVFAPTILNATASIRSRERAVETVMHYSRAFFPTPGDTANSDADVAPLPRASQAEEIESVLSFVRLVIAFDAAPQLADTIHTGVNPRAHLEMLLSMKPEPHLVPLLADAMQLKVLVSQADGVPRGVCEAKAAQQRRSAFSRLIGNATTRSELEHVRSMWLNSEMTAHHGSPRSLVDAYRDCEKARRCLERLEHAKSEQVCGGESAPPHKSKRL